MMMPREAFLKLPGALVAFYLLAIAGSHRADAATTYQWQVSPTHISHGRSAMYGLLLDTVISRRHSNYRRAVYH